MTYSDFSFTVLDTDARARLTIYMINHANSPLIAQLGDLSHDTFRGGFIFGDGLLTVSGDASCVQALLYSQEAIFAPSQASLPNSTSQSYDCIPTAFEQRICSVLPPDMMLLLSEKDDQHDFIFLCRMLGLDMMDFDKINNGIFIRTFADRKITNLPYDWIGLPIIAHDNSFFRLNVIVNGDLFELKCFKYVDYSGIYVFRFKPEHSGIWFPDGLPVPGTTVIIDTCIMDVWNRISPANAGLIDVGEISEIDWKHFIGHEVQYVWRHDTFQCKNDFSKALHFLAEAKKNDIDVSVLKYSTSTQAGEILDLPEVIKQARCYGLVIPAQLKETGYVHVSTPQDEFIPDDIPFFWSRGGSTLFFSSGYRAMLKKILAAFCRKTQDTQTVKAVANFEKAVTCSGIFPRKRVGILYPISAEVRTNKLLGKNFLGLPCISVEILQKEDALETVLYQHKIEVLFIVYADELAVKDLTAILELCEHIRIITGVFSPVAAEDEPAPEDVLKGATKELVAQFYYVTADGDSVIAKDMETEITEHYTFEKNGMVSVSEVKATKTVEDEEE